MELDSSFSSSSSNGKGSQIRGWIQRQEKEINAGSDEES